jgi:DNA-binding transcriptional MerR regulator
MSQVPLTIGQIAKRFGCPPWAVRRLFERGLLPEPPRVGAYRVVAPEKLPQVETALREAGYLPEGGPSHAAP